MNAGCLRRVTLRPQFRKWTFRIPSLCYFLNPIAFDIEDVLFSENSFFGLVICPETNDIKKCLDTGHFAFEINLYPHSQH